MIAIILWCSFAILIGNRASPTKRDLYAIAEDSEAAASNDYLDPRREELAEFGSDHDRLDRSDDPPSPEDHVIPYSEHEKPRDVPTKPNYTAPGVWAKPDPKKNIPLNFTPTKSLAQVRGTHTVRVLPRSASIALAGTDEEKLNAPRLREVVSKKKTNTIYTEEGYEDSAYDHGGHVRDADFHEGYARKLHDQVDDRGESGSRGPQEPRRRRKLKKAPIVDSFDEFADDYRDEPSSRTNEAEEPPKKKKKKKKKSNKVKKSRKDPWLRADVDPKVVAENEIEKLENDLQREGEEAETGSEINAVNSVETSSKGERKEDGTGYASNEVEAPTTEHYYVPVDAMREDHQATTLVYGDLNVPVAAIDEATTTLTYGDESWNNYQVNPTEATMHGNFIAGQTIVEQQLREATTLGPPGENPTPLTIATINGHGPYLLLSDYDESTRSPKHFDFSSSSSIGLSTTAPTFSYYTAAQQDIPVENNRHSANPTLMPRDYLFGGGRISGFDDTTSHPDALGFTDVGRSYDAWGLHEPKYASQLNAIPATSFPTVGYYDGSYSNTPTYSGEIVNLEKNGGERLEVGTSKWDYIPGLAYNKMLEYIRGDRTRGSEKSESEVLEGFTIMKPPTLGRFSFTDLTPNSHHKVVGSSSVAQESAVPRAIEREKSKVNKNGSNHGTRLGKETNVRSMKLGAGSSHRAGLFPATKLLPPEPSPYDARFYSNDPANGYQSGVNPNPMLAFSRIGHIYDPDFQRLPGIRNSRGCPRRCGRSVEAGGLDEAKIADAVIAQEINARLNLTFGDRSSEPKSRVKRYLADEAIRSSVARDEVPFEKPHCREETEESEARDRCGSRSKVNHEELLNSSPRIAGEVIDSEIESRFKTPSRETEEDGENDEEVGDHADQTVDEHEDEDEEEEEEEEKGSEKVVDVEEPDLDYLDEIQDLNEIDDVPTTTVKSIDPRKYPFYSNEKIPHSSPLKYIVDPKSVPKKSLGGMEFYDSRDRYVHCENVDPDLEGIVEEEPEPDRGPKQNLPRLKGLGDKLDCFKAKYFDENPFDSPIFFEKRILQPTPPAELDPVKFAERISTLPEEEPSYVIQAQSKRPEDSGSRRIRKVVAAETLPITTPRSRTNRKPIPVTLMVAANKPQTKKPPVRRRRPLRKMQPTTTEIIPSSVSTSPYQKAVYDDVMGTIRNLASIYEMVGSRETSTVPKVNLPKEHRGSIGMTTVGHGSVKKARREEIEGLLPPPQLAKKASFREPEKVASSVRPRTESPGKEKIVGYLTTVRVQKRSLEPEDSTPMSVHGRRRRRRDVAATTEKPKRGRRRHTDFTTAKAPAMDSGNKTDEAPKHTTYMSRSRKSRKNGEQGRHGLFTTTPNPSTLTDVRRKEPRYNEISRRTTTTPPSSLGEEVASPQTDVSSSTESEGTRLRSNDTSSVVDLEPSGGIYRAVTSELNDREAEEASKDEGTLDSEGNQETREKSGRTKRKYRVHENVEEVDTAPGTIGGSRAEESDDPDPLTYLSEDSVGYEKEPSDFSPRKKVSEDDYSEGKSKRGEDVEEDEEIRDSGERGSSGEDDAESGGSAEAYNESRSDEDSGEKRKSDEKENAEEETFFRFDNRPDSPSESFEDDSFAGLGPRVNKPAFHHPRFRVPMFERQKFGIGSDDDEDEAEETSDNDKYVFPWNRDEDEGEKDSREYSPFTYEYPWEKRERLARERKKRMKERARLRKIMGYSDDEEDAEELERDDDERKPASSSNYKSHVYPWDTYDTPSQKNYRSRFDSDEMGSEQLPVANFNSKYTSLDFTLPMQVKKSVLNFLNKSSDSAEPTVAYETPYPVFTTTSAPSTTESTTIAAVVATTTETSQIVTTQKTLARPSESRIIPENVTMSPKRRTRGRGLTGTRNNLSKVKSTEATSPTTQRSTSRWRKMTDRVGRKSARKAQESQVSTVTELPSSESTSPESRRAVDTSSIKQSRKLTVQRGKTRGSPRTTEASRDGSEMRTEAAAGTKRRRMRPSATIVTTSPRTTEKKGTKETTRKLLKVTDKVTDPTASLEVTDESVEDPTPTRRRVEHRSLVSSEEFITKTTFPDDGVVYKVHKDKITTRKKNSGDDEAWTKTRAITSKPKKFSKVTKPLRGSLDEADGKARLESEEAPKTSLLINSEFVSGTRDTVDSDGSKGTANGFATKNRRAPSALEDELHLRRAEMQRHGRKNGRYENDPTNGNKEDTTSILATDIILLNNLLQRSPPRANRSVTTNSPSGRETNFSDFTDESDDFYLESEYESDNEEEASQPIIEIDPSRRLYHYVEDE